METTVRFTVDAAFCDRAGEELFKMLRQQHAAFAERLNARCYVSPVLTRVASIFCIVICTFVLWLAILLLSFDTPEWYSQPSVYLIPLSATLIVVFVLLLLPRTQPRMKAWSSRVSERLNRRSSARMLRTARALAPFEACYHLQGDLLIYTRGKGSEWSLVWHRKLKRYRANGIAKMSGNLTAIFPKAKALSPVALILQVDPEWTRVVLNEAGITVQQ
jgi:hypothetical protein